MNQFLIEKNLFVFSACVHAKVDSAVEASERGTSLGIRQLLQDKRRVGDVGQLERIG